MPSIQIAPCRRCGSMALLAHPVLRGARIRGLRVWSLTCAHCGQTTGNAPTKGMAISAWNKAYEENKETTK